jgi:hypothetical protein
MRQPAYVVRPAGPTTAGTGRMATKRCLPFANSSRLGFPVQSLCPDVLWGLTQRVFCPNCLRVKES